MNSSLVVLSISIVLGAEPASPLPRGHVVLEAGFEGEDALRGWSGAAAIEGGHESPRSAAIGAGTISRPLPAEALRGHLLRISATVRGADVSAPPNPWNGVKLMLAIEAPGGRQWPQARIPAGTFDWRRAALSARVPRDATGLTLVLGLEAVTGKVWFDDLRVTVARPPSSPRAAPPAAAPFKGHDLPRLRGAMVGPRIDAAGLRTFGRDWNANLVRWQLIRSGRPGESNPLADYERWLEGELARLDAVLPACAESGLLVALDLHSPPGGRATAGGYYGSDDRLFTDPACQSLFVECWRKIAKRYRGVKTIWGFDLANEPVEDLVDDGCDDWRDLAERAGRAVREVDPDRTLIVEAPPWGSPDSLSDFEPLDLPRVVYSCHMYVPGEFTHQGVFRRDGEPVLYPGTIGGKRWDRAALEEVLRPVAEFQARTGAHIYIGEFSAIRWAPDGSAGRWLSDVIEILESRGWDWSYHAFREWQGWSVEHGSDRNDERPAAEPTDRERLLRGWFAKNEKPAPRG